MLAAIGWPISAPAPARCLEGQPAPTRDRSPPDAVRGRPRRDERTGGCQAPSVARAHPPRAGVDLEALLAEPGRALTLEPDVAAGLLGPVAALHACLAARVAGDAAARTSPEPRPAGEHLLTAAEVAARLGVSKDWVYRRSGRLPIAVRLDGHVRFQAAGLERYLKTR